MTIESEQANFRSWLLEMPHALDRFFAKLPEHVRRQLDFSPESLDVLEKWLLATFTTVEELRAPEHKALWDGIGRYIGETYRRSLGGRWDIRFDDPKYIYFGVPQITGFSPHPTPICPHALSTVAIDWKEGSFLRTILQKAQEAEAGRR